MNIGLLLPSVYMGKKYTNKIFAPKQLFLDLADGLVARGHTVYVYASPDTKTTAHLISGHHEFIDKDFMSVKFKGLEKLTKKRYAHLTTKTEYEIDLSIKAYVHAKEKKVAIMHSFHDFIAHYINQLANLPTVYTIHDPLPRKDLLEYWRIKHFSHDNYIFISQSHLKNFHGSVKSAGVAYNGVDIRKFSFRQEEGTYLAFIGRYIKEKGVEHAISASKSAGILLKLIGDDAYRALPYYQTYVLPHLKHGVLEDETFFGESDRSEFLKNAKALLFPILWEEPFGMVMIEAMSSGTPVIAYNRGSVSEVIRDGVTGFIIDPDNVRRPGKGSWIIKEQGIAGLAEAVKRIGQIDRAVCRKHVEDNFTIEKMIDNYENIYKKIINSATYKLND
ncbi:hypothetical protein A3D80_01460 [Candidatus Roizmanbacteria bacterium RIFCSPHIGHO2_02_FULL_40_13b]|nr:MAG: hypothetical protein A3D80_01460 [Candidatus Roizmanbacteria bacterium RIFCSPHIGHO2_02_FULL_40_13b]OGK57233.1 MAG: hypothetical protein A3H83_03875 [Candidatus Roizmanbacteria bacterium RIFCSPLOWO2_02_FULL_39_8]